MFIYALFDPRNNSIRYVGKTTNRCSERLRCHVWDRRRSHKRNWIQSLLAIGLLPRLEIIEAVPRERWREAERFWITYLRFLGCQLTNVAAGGDGADSVSPSTRHQMSVHSKTHPLVGPRMRQLNLSRKGIPLSEEHRSKISLGGRGLTRSAETRNRMSRARVGIVYSEETRRKMSLAKKGQPGRPQTLAERIKRSATMKRIKSAKRKELLHHAV